MMLGVDSRGINSDSRTMAGFVGKRKELEQVVDGLSDFSLSGPAAKSRRLVSQLAHFWPVIQLYTVLAGDYYCLFELRTWIGCPNPAVRMCRRSDLLEDPGLPPIMEEEPPAPSMAFQYEMLGKESSSGVNMPSVEDMMETSISPCVSSEDMALVLYKPVDNPVLFGPGISGTSFIVSSDVLLGLKNHVLNQGNYRELEDKSPGRSNSLALIPWTPPQISLRTDCVASEPQTTQNFEMPMEADETEVTSMDVEEAPGVTAVGLEGENPHQRQQHCMTPPLLPNPSAHVMWSM